jgi:hypothetical protein
VFGRDPQAARSRSADEQRRVPSLHRLGPQTDRIEVDELAMELRLIIGPDRLHCRELLPHQIPPQVRLDTGVAHLLHQPPGADAEQESAPGKMVDCRDLLRQDDRVMLGNDAYRRAEPQARGDRGGSAQHGERIQNAGRPPVKLVLENIPAARRHMRVLDYEKRLQSRLLYHPRHIDDPGGKVGLDDSYP